MHSATRRQAGLHSFAAACLAALFVATPLAASAAERLVGSGRSATEARSPGDFEAISLRDSIDIVVRQGAATQVTASADDNLLPLLETFVEPARNGNGNRLVVRWKANVDFRARQKARVEVTVPRLVALAGSGSGDVRIEAFETPKLRIALSGSGDAALQSLKTAEFEISLSGSGDVKADGQAARLKVSIAGSGDVSAAELRADDVTINIAGSGDVAVHAQRKLVVSIAGSGDVVYSGDAEVTRSVAGSGSVKRR